MRPFRNEYRLTGLEHMDDFICYDRGLRLVVVARLDLRLGRIHHCCVFHLPHWSDRCNVSHQFSGRVQSQLWHLGIPLARVQSSRHGLCLVSEILETFLYGSKAHKNLGTAYKPGLEVNVSNCE